MGGLISILYCIIFGPCFIDYSWIILHKHRSDYAVVPNQFYTEHGISTYLYTTLIYVCVYVYIKYIFVPHQIYMYTTRFSSQFILFSPFAILWTHNTYEEKARPIYLNWMQPYSVPLARLLIIYRSGNLQIKGATYTNVICGCVFKIIHTKTLWIADTPHHTYAIMWKIWLDIKKFFWQFCLCVLLHDD